MGKGSSGGGTGWVRSQRARQNGDVMVKVDVAKLDKAWKDDAMYVGKGQGGQKLSNARKYLRDHKSGVQAPQVTFSGGKASVTDGRHRLAAWRASGKKTIYVTVPKGQAASVRKKLGAK